MKRFFSLLWLAAIVLTSIWLTSCGSAGAKSSNNDQQQQQGPPPKPTVTLTANPTTISGDESSSNLAWTSTNATAVVITPGIGAQSSSGALDVLPSDTTTYTATATGPGGISDPRSVTVIVAKPLDLLFQANPPEITPGQSTNLTWTTKGALSLSIDNGIGSQAPVASGSVSVSPATTTTYTATATGTNSQVLSSQVTVTVQPVLVTLATSQICINPGSSASLSYTSQGAATVSIDNGVGDVTPPSGAVSVSPSVTTTYTATAVDSTNHSATAQVAVQVGDCGGINQIKHIIFFMQENRSFDNYFGVLGAYRASKGFGLPTDVDGFDPNKGLPDLANPSHLIKPYHFRTQCTKLVTPGWNESHYDVHYSASSNSYQSSATPMEGFLKTTTSVDFGNDPTGERAMGYYDQTDLPYYYELATQYATSDRWFSAALAPTIPNRMYLMTGTSFGFIRPDPNPHHVPYPQKTFFRALTEAGITWRYYYQDSSVFLPEFTDWATEQGKVRNISEYYSILAGADADSKLPQVIFIERAAQLGFDEHPHGKGVQVGSANTKKIIDALMNSAAWPSSAFILYYDEGGGFHDHVPPISVTPPDSTPPNLKAGDRSGDFATSGFRTPLIVISPFVKPHYVSHTPMESTSVWKFVETRFGMAPLTQRDATANDMTEFFDFVSPSRLAIPPLPAQPTSDPCDNTLQTDPNQP